MNDPIIGAAIDEAENEAWAVTYANLRDSLERLRSVPELGESLADLVRDIFKNGWLRGYRRGLDELKDRLK